MRGKFITIYGVNNMGKSTHAKRLVARLLAAGRDAVYVKYPVYDMEPTGPFINNVLRGGHQNISEQELQLWFALNRFQFEPQLKKWLEEGKIVVAEDYIGTGMAWGMAKGLSESWVENVNQGLMKEDLAILIEGERIVAATEKGHVHEENNTLIEICYGKFQTLAEKYGWEKVRLQNKIEDTEELIWGKI